jgi:hypothetical protein
MHFRYRTNGLMQGTYVFVILNKPGVSVQYFIVPGRVLTDEPERFTKWFVDPKFPGIPPSALKPFEDAWGLFSESVNSDSAAPADGRAPVEENMNIKAEQGTEDQITRLEQSLKDNGYHQASKTSAKQLLPGEYMKSSFTGSDTNLSGRGGATITWCPLSC